jgi:diguanylate cyclase (GGDEF)-like protein/putative nucleotidyltransferase with HDIG domain
MWRELPPKLRLYIVLLNALAVPIFVQAIWQLFHGQYDSGWIVLTALTVVTVPAFQLLQSEKTITLIGDAYVMAISMLYGPAPCIAATVCHTLVGSFYTGPHSERKREIHSYQVAFNVASTVCCAWAYSNVYRFLNHSYSKQVPDIALPIVALALAFFILNSLSTATAIGLASKQNIFKFWEQNYLSLGVEFSISSVCAALIVTLNQFGSWGLAAAPLIAVVWWWNKLNKTRAVLAEKHLKEQEQLYIRTVESLALAVDAKDQTTYGHIRRVKVYAMGLARLCGITDENELKAIETGSLLHDIGKIAIDDYILNKPGRLSEKEFEKIKMHATAGDEILQQVCFPFPVAKYVRYHHERWDGHGYPDGLKGEEIPVGARILSIADAFDAIRFSRPYKLPVATEEAIEILRAQAGIVYDPRLVQVFTNHIHDLEQAAIKESENAPKLSFRKASDESASPQADSPTMILDIPNELVQLVEFCNTISGYLRLTDFLHVISLKLEKLVPFSTCVFFANRGNEWVGATHVSGKFSEQLQGLSMEIGKGISGWVAAYRKPMMNTSPALEFQNVAGDFSSYKDTLVVPIIASEDCLGTISLYAQEPMSYGQDELRILQTVASVLGPVLWDFKKNGFSEPRDVVDPATHLHRISYLTTVGPQIITSAGETRKPISLIYLEIRNLGQIAKIFGSNLANSIVKQVADCIKPELRETDILVRYGNLGFVAFLPGVRNEQALRCAQRLKQQIKAGSLTPGQGFTIDCQTGVSFYPKDGSSVLDLLQSAQENLRSDSAEKSASENNVIDFHRA